MSDMSSFRLPSDMFIWQFDLSQIIVNLIANTRYGVLTPYNTFSGPATNFDHIRIK